MRPPDPVEKTIATVIAQAGVTFETVLEILHAHSRQAGSLTAPYVMAAGAAADGRDALITAPSASLLSPDLSPSFPLPGPGAGAAVIAEALAAVAGALADRLAQAAPIAPDLRDREALSTASLAAAAVRDCLLGTG